jgi:hypothetical protein
MVGEVSQDASQIHVAWLTFLGAGWNRLSGTSAELQYSFRQWPITRWLHNLQV